MNSDERPSAIFKPPAPARLQFSLATLLVATTVLAILCTLAAVMPWFGPILVLLVPPAVVRTGIALYHSLVDSMFPPLVNKLGLFFSSLVLVAWTFILTGMCGALAAWLCLLLAAGLDLLVGTPSSAMHADPFLSGSFLFGLLVAGLLSYRLLLFSTPVGPPPRVHSRAEKSAMAFAVLVSIVGSGVTFYLLGQR